MRVEIESRAEFASHLARHGQIRNAFVQSVHLDGYDFRHLDVAGTLFLGCTFDPGMQSVIRNGGGLVFPRIPNLPFNPYRTRMWDADSLYAGIANGYSSCTDGRIYRWWQESLTANDLEAELACTLHDHSMIDALGDTTAKLDRTEIVGIMGGHAAQRGTEAYLAAAELGWALAEAGKVVITGGGPGAMEAANLGAACAAGPEAVVAAVAELKSSARWEEDPTGWAQAALNVRSQGDFSRFSLGIPTWFYGHEPPNVFAAASAKFFNNALREEALLRLSRGGIIYTPGAAGTVQEVFQSVTDCYYAQTAADLVPLVLLGVEHWTQKLPVWPLLQALARGRLMANSIFLVDEIDEAVELLS